MTTGRQADASNSRAVAVADLLNGGQFVSVAGTAAIARAEAAGLTLGPEVFFGMISVRRALGDAVHVWLDVGDTVCVLGDASDIDDALLRKLIEVLDDRDRPSDASVPGNEMLVEHTRRR